MGIRVISDQSLAFLQYVFIDNEGNEIDVKEEKDLPSKARQSS